MQKTNFIVLFLFLGISGCCGGLVQDCGSCPPATREEITDFYIEAVVDEQLGEYKITDYTFKVGTPLIYFGINKDKTWRFNLSFISTAQALSCITTWVHNIESIRIYATDDIIDANIKSGDDITTLFSGSKGVGDIATYSGNIYTHETEDNILTFTAKDQTIIPAGNYTFRMVINGVSVYSPQIIIH